MNNRHHRTKKKALMIRVINADLGNHYIMEQVKRSLKKKLKTVMFFFHAKFTLVVEVIFKFVEKYLIIRMC